MSELPCRLIEIRAVKGSIWLLVRNHVILRSQPGWLSLLFGPAESSWLPMITRVVPRAQWCVPCKRRNTAIVVCPDYLMFLVFKDIARAQHAFKVALAMVISFAVALSLNWLNPYWAGFAVAFCALATLGESLLKSVYRILGTLAGVIASLILLACFAQQRWLFFLGLSSYLAVITYVMNGAKAQYFWQASGFVALLIVGAAVGAGFEPGYVFELCMARMQETILGCVVWALVDIFVWPVTNERALQQSAVKLMSAQRGLLEYCEAQTLGVGAADLDGDEFASLKSDYLKLIAGMDGQLKAAGAESYMVREMKTVWRGLLEDSRRFLFEVDGWSVGLAELRRLNMAAAMPELQALVGELVRQLEVAESFILGSDAGSIESRTSPASDVTVFRVGDAQLAELGDFDRAAVVSASAHIEMLARIVRDLRDKANRFVEPGIVRGEPDDRSVSRMSDTFFLDLDRLRGAVFVFMSAWVSYLLWILVDPPGHQSMWILVPNMALAMTFMPHLPAAKGILKVVAVFLPVAGLIYILVMPALSNFLQLSVVIFLYVYWAQYFLKNPLAVLAAMMGLLVMMPISNTQSYSFLTVVNAYLMIIFAILIAFCCAYMLGTQRPEKMFARLVRRYFRSADFVMRDMVSSSAARHAFAYTYKIAFHRYELRTLPRKLSLWGGQINRQSFPGNTTEETDALIRGLAGLSYRLHQFEEMGRLSSERLLVPELIEAMQLWQQAMQKGFTQTSGGELVGTAEDLASSLEARMRHVEKIIRDIDPSVSSGLKKEEVENLYQVLAVYRGVAQAAIDWVAAAEKVDWSHWNEERFA